MKTTPCKEKMYNKVKRVAVSAAFDVSITTPILRVVVDEVRYDTMRASMSLWIAYDL